MIEAVLFDLDDTLLANDMAVFLPEYIHGLAEWANPCADKKRFVPALRNATQAMMQAPHEVSNALVFWQTFERLARVSRAQAEPLFEVFLRDRLPKLRHLTRRVPFARELVEHCFEAGVPVVVATNPVFPRGAIVERLRWAGLSPDEFRFAQVTTFENTRATKPHPAYYLDIVHQLGRAPGSVLMVGNSRGADISPAQAAGLRTLHVCDASAAPFEASEWQLHEDVERALQSDAPSGSLRAVLQYLKNELS